MRSCKNSSFKNAITELRNITTIDLACKAASFLEKVLWAFIGVLGTIWAVYFIGLQFIAFDENASVLIQGNSEEIELKHPAITICPKVSSKHGIAEQLANYADPDKLPEKLWPLKKEFLKCGLGKIIMSPLKIIENYDDAYWVENYFDSGWGKISSLLILEKQFDFFWDWYLIKITI